MVSQFCRKFVKVQAEDRCRIYPKSNNEYKPQIVHFSGHGSSSGEIILADNSDRSKPISAKALKALFHTLKDNIQVVVLNACHSEVQSRAIVEVIDCVIGMKTAIGDQAAIVFASSFYRAIGFGRSVQQAFEQGKTALLLEGIPEEKTPILLARQGANPSQIFLVEPQVSLIYGYFDSPPYPGATLQDTVQIWGWTNVEGSNVSQVGVWIDNTFRGNAIYGTPRPEAGGNYGFYWDWDTTQYKNGAHIIEIRVVAANGKSALLPSAVNRKSRIKFQIEN